MHESGNNTAVSSSQLHRAHLYKRANFSEQLAASFFREAQKVHDFRLPPRFFPRYYTASSGSSLPTFRDNLSVPYSKDQE